jgi:hypothetical protein
VRGPGGRQRPGAVEAGTGRVAHEQGRRGADMGRRRWRVGHGGFKLLGRLIRAWPSEQCGF